MIAEITGSEITGSVLLIIIPAQFAKYQYKGTNGVSYFENVKTGRHFNSNQYVRTHSLKAVYKSLSKTSRNLNRASMASDISRAYIADGHEIGYTTQRTACVVSGKLIGSKLGYHLGGWAGSAIGGGLGAGTSFGLGTIPAATAGKISGSILGSVLGDEVGGWVGGFLYDCFY